MPLFATNVESQINQLQKELLEKSNQRVFYIRMCNLALQSPRKKDSRFFGLCDSLLMGICQDLHQNPAVYTEEDNRGRNRGSVCCC